MEVSLGDSHKIANCTEGAMKEKPGRQGRGWAGGRGLYLSGQVIRKGFPEEVTFQLWPAGFRG